MSDYVVRRARPCEFDVLTELAFASKSFWGYSDVLLAACGDELTLTEEFIEAGVVLAAEKDGFIGGFLSITRERAAQGLPGGHRLRQLYVRPELLGLGVGSALLDSALRECARVGIARLFAVSDPNAAGFFEKRGAALIGEKRAPIAGMEPSPVFALDSAGYLE